MIIRTLRLNGAILLAAIVVAELWRVTGMPEEEAERPPATDSPGPPQPEAKQVETAHSGGAAS